MTLTDDRRDELFSFGDDPSPAEDAEPGRRLRHVPALDGLRGVAVLAVVLYHFEITVADRWLAKGGFLGVDAFFVLSGYLITGLLLAEWRRADRINLREFWTRRAKRLFPALVVAFVFLILMAAFAYGPDLREALRRQMTSTLFYGANWFFVFSGESYGQQFSAPSPLRHMWSLAIEEQFYLVWPLVVIAVLRWKRQARAVMWTGLILSVVSAVWMAAQFLPDQDPSRIYYGTDTRVQSLALGAALAAALAEGITLRSDAARRGLALLAAALSLWLAVAWSRTSYLSDWLYTGGFLMLALSVCVIILACVDGPPPGWGNPVAAALSWGPLRGLGVISYGVYLYHWIVFVYLGADRTGLTGAPLTMVRLLATFALAVPSYYLIERPVRHGTLLQRLHWRPVFMPVVVILVLFGILLATMDARCMLCPPEKSAPPAAPTTLPGETRSPIPKVMLVGDSVAFSLSFGFEGNAETQKRATLWNQAQYYCELIKAPRRESNGKEIAHSIMCDNWPNDWTSAKTDFKPDLVLLGIGAWEIFDRRIDGEWITYGTPEFDALLGPKLQEVVDTLSDDRTKIVLLTSPYLDRQDADSSPEWRLDQSDRIDHLNDLLRRVAAANPDRVKVIEYGAYLCPTVTTCAVEIDGVRLRPDGMHYEGPGAAKVTPWIAEQLAAIHNAGQGDAATPAPDATAPRRTASSAPATSAPATSAPETTAPATSAPETTAPATPPEPTTTAAADPSSTTTATTGSSAAP